MTYNAASRKDIRTAEKSQLAISTIDREVIAGLMSVANGRHWINERLAEAGVFRDPFSPDALVNAYQAGLRAIGIKLFNDIILYAPDQFVQMIREAHERSAAADARADTKPDPYSGTDPWADPESYSGAYSDAPEGAELTQ